MKMLTPQEIYDKVKTGLLQQGKQSLGEEGGCCYRGEGGLKCAVGLLFEDQHYHPAMEGLAVGGCGGTNPLLREALLAGGVDISKYECNYLVEELQRMHDSEDQYTPPEQWESHMQTIATERGLQP